MLLPQTAPPFPLAWGFSTKLDLPESLPKPELSQVHGCGVVEARGGLQEADGIWTLEPGRRIEWLVTGRGRREAPNTGLQETPTLPYEGSGHDALDYPLLEGIMDAVDVEIRRRHIAHQVIEFGQNPLVKEVSSLLLAPCPLLPAPTSIFSPNQQQGAVGPIQHGGGDTAVEDS